MFKIENNCSLTYRVDTIEATINDILKLRKNITSFIQISKQNLEINNLYKSDDEKQNSDIEQCKSEISGLNDKLVQLFKQISLSKSDNERQNFDIVQGKSDDEKQISEIARCKSEISGLNDKLVQLSKQISGYKSNDEKQISDIERCKSNDEKQIFEIERCKSEISGLKDSIKDTKQTINYLKEDVITNLAETQKTTILDTKITTDLILKHNGQLDHLKKEIEQIDYIVKNLAKNDKDRLNETKDLVKMLMSHNEDISKLKINATSPQDILDLKKIQEFKFSLNSKGVFHNEIKKTIFFSPGLILPSTVYVYSLYITTIKNKSSKRVFDFMIIKDDIFETLRTFDNIVEGTLMENFDPPIEIPLKTKIIISCDKKIDAMAILTLRY
jgi:chromosome segregation ATPase